MKVELIARKGFGVTPKGGRVRLPRDHAAVLVKMGLAEYAPVAVKAPPLSLPKKGTYAHRAMVAETPAAKEWPQTISRISEGQTFAKDVNVKT